MALLRINKTNDNLTIVIPYTDFPYVVVTNKHQVQLTFQPHRRDTITISIDFSHYRTAETLANAIEDYISNLYKLLNIVPVMLSQQEKAMFQMTNFIKTVSDTQFDTLQTAQEMFNSEIAMFDITPNAIEQTLESAIANKKLFTQYTNEIMRGKAGGTQ